MRQNSNCSHTSMVLLCCVQPERAAPWRALAATHPENQWVRGTPGWARTLKPTFPRFLSQPTLLPLSSQHDRQIQFALAPSSVFTARGAGTAILRTSTGNVVDSG